MKSSLVLSVLFATLLSSSAFALESKTCRLHRLVDPANENTNSPVVKAILESKGYEVVDIGSLDETKTLPVDTFWGYFDLTPNTVKSFLMKQNTCTYFVSFYQVTAEQDSQKLIYNSRGTNSASAFKKKDPCADLIDNNLGWIPKCNKVPTGT